MNDPQKKEAEKKQKLAADLEVFSLMWDHFEPEALDQIYNTKQECTDPKACEAVEHLIAYHK